MKIKESLLLIAVCSLALSGCNSSSSEEKPVDTLKEMPVFHIDTENATPITSKEEYVQATLSISNTDKHDAGDLTLGIRGRGNYSWSGTEKKSYRIKFDKKYQPLGQGKGPAKSWTLLAVHCDKSLLRTDAAFYFANKLENLLFTSSSSFVQLYLNGQYDGVYEFCEQMQVNKYRVDIDDTGTDTDIGYLLELDKNASEDVIYLNSGETFELKSDHQNESQMEYITNYMQDCEDAIKGGDQVTISNLIDIGSAVDAYLVEELFKNLDVGWGSFYYNKPAGEKLKFGPVWDFDLCAGNADSDDSRTTKSFRDYKYTYVGNSYYSNYMQQHSWYLNLRKQSWFNDLIKDRWFEVKEFAIETVTHIQDMAHDYHDDFEKNFERWKIFNKKINREPSNILAIKSFDGQVEFLVNWLNGRIEWLDGFYQGENSDINKL